MVEVSSTVIHFTGMQMLLITGLFLLAVLVPLWLLKRFAQIVPPVYKVNGIPSGVGGLLLMVVGILIAQAVPALYHLGRSGASVVRVLEVDVAFWWAAVQTLIPDLVTVVCLLTAIGALIFGRTPWALRLAIVMAWLGGPLVAFLRHLYLGLPLEVAGEPTGLFFLTVVMTIYLLFSNRPALTYGTEAGRHLAEQRGVFNL